jgi:hypothetical protein
VIRKGLWLNLNQNHRCPRFSLSLSLVVVVACCCLCCYLEGARAVALDEVGGHVLRQLVVLIL